MKRKTIILLLIAVSCVLIGCILFLGVMMGINWDFSKLSTVEYETNEYEIQDIIQNFRIVTDTADIELVPAENIRVICTEQINARHIVSVEDGTLQIKIDNRIKWYEYLGLNFGKPKITVYVPAGQYVALSVEGSTGDITIPQAYEFTNLEILQSTGNVICNASAMGDMKIQTSTGQICLEDLYAGSLELSVSTGNIKVSNVNCGTDINIRVSTGNAFLTYASCKNLSTDGNTGNITMKDVVASGKFTIKRTTGDVNLENCDAAELCVTTDTGDVTGSLASEKLFICKTNTGRVEVPATTFGGKCEITTTSGDIRLKISH